MGPDKPLKKLTPMHHRFIAHYVARPHNASAAYIAAGYSPQGARQSAHNLLKDPLIKAEVARLIEEKHKALQMDVDEILGRVAMLARINVAALFDENGKMKPLHELEEHEALAIAGVEVEEIASGTGKKREVIGSVKKVRLRDPMAALRLLAEHKKLVRNNDEGVNALASAIADRLKAAREKVRKSRQES